MSIEQAIALSTCKGDLLFPPSRDVLEMAPKVYADFKKLLTCNFAKWQAGKQCFKFPFDASELLGKLQAGGRPNYRQDWHYFPTPLEVIEQMFTIHLPLYDGDFLEPSAGRGAIVDAFMDLGARHHQQNWDLIEAEPMNRKALEAKGYRLAGADFMDFQTEKRYDAIYANPPFRHDLAHVEKMISLLGPRGVLTCVLPSSFPTKYAKQVQRWEADCEDLIFYPVQEGAFKSSGTGVSTVILNLNN